MRKYNVFWTLDEANSHGGYSIREITATTRAAIYLTSIQKMFYKETLMCK